jgi:hypothetical protein
MIGFSHEWSRGGVFMGKVEVERAFPSAFLAFRCQFLYHYYPAIICLNVCTAELVEVAVRRDFAFQHSWSYKHWSRHKKHRYTEITLNWFITSSEVGGWLASYCLSSEFIPHRSDVLCFGNTFVCSDKFPNTGAICMILSIEGMPVPVTRPKLRW